MKIYTKTGDDGTTGLIGGARIEKSDQRIATTGAIDELNAAIGLARAAIEYEDLLGKLAAVQSELFAIGSHLAVADGIETPAHLPLLDESMVRRLEKEIDSAEGDLSPLRQFILPGGSESSARLHMARTICRRAERELATLRSTRTIVPLIFIYINRLSDWLFVQARWANLKAGIADLPWSGK